MVIKDDALGVARECEAMVQTWRKKTSDLEAQLNARDVKYNELQKKTQEKDRALKDADAKQLRIIQLENQILQTQRKAERDLGRARVAHRNELSAMEVQLNLLRREASHRADAEKEAQKLRRDLASYQQNLKLARFEGAELRAESALRDRCAGFQSLQTQSLWTHQQAPVQSRLPHQLLEPRKSLTIPLGTASQVHCGSLGQLRQRLVSSEDNELVLV